MTMNIAEREPYESHTARCRLANALLPAPRLLHGVRVTCSFMTPLKSRGFYRSPAPTCTHLHSPALALRASAVQVCAAAQRRCQGTGCDLSVLPGPLARATCACVQVQAGRAAVRRRFFRRVIHWIATNRNLTRDRDTAGAPLWARDNLSASCWT